MKRRSMLLDAVDLGASGTKTIDLPRGGQISALWVIFDITLVTVSVMTNTLRSAISKVEVTDGGQTLWSGSGDALSAIAWYNTGKMPFTQLSLTVGDHGICAIPIYFGRQLWDSEYAFVPERFINPQLKITFDEDAANGSVVVNACSVVAAIDTQPTGGLAGHFLSVMDVKTYNFTASSHEYSDLPTMEPIRAIYQRLFSTDHDGEVLLSSVKLDANSGGEVLIDENAATILQSLVDFGLASYPVVLDEVVTAKDLYVPTGSHNKLQINYDGTAVITTQSLFAVGAYLGQLCDMAASVDIQADTGVVTGYMPGGVLPLYLGDKDDQTSWYVPRREDSLVLDVLSSSDADVGDSNEILVETVKSP